MSLAVQEAEEWTHEVLILKFKIYIYGTGMNVNISHSFCINDMPCGTSPQIGDIKFDIRSTSFKQLRNMLEYDRSDDMLKRSLIFQEALSIMGRLPNISSRPKQELNRYLFGFVRKDNRELKIVDGNQEGQIVESFLEQYEFFVRNLMIIPLSQLLIGSDM
jgi:hypothetical protein